MNPNKIRSNGMTRNSQVYQDSPKINEKDLIEKAFEDKFYCPAKFAQEIEQMVQLHPDMNYIDAIVSFCEINSIDVQSVPKLISKPLKEKIKYEAQELNFLKKTSRAKLIF